MATILRQITDRIDAILRAQAPAGSQVYRDRVDAISREEAPAINHIWHAGQPESFSDDTDLHTLEVEISFHVRAEPFTPPAEDLHEAVHNPIVTDGVLKSLAISIRLVDQMADLAEADETAGIKTARYRFKYLISTSTL